MKLDSKMVHIGVRSDKTTGAISTPIYQTASFQHPAVGKSTGFDYTRSQKFIQFAESLGGVETLITFPAKQTHADIPEATRELLGINDRLLRLSVGIENVDDIISDLEQALNA